MLNMIHNIFQHKIASCCNYSGNCSEFHAAIVKSPQFWLCGDNFAFCL